VAMALAIALSLLALPSAAPAEAAGGAYVAASDANVRTAPSLTASVVTRVNAGDSIAVTGSTRGQSVSGNSLWYVTRSGYYISASVVSQLQAGSSPSAGRAGRWIDVNLSSLVARAMEGNQTVFSAPIAPGRPGWETPAGTFRVLRKTPSTNMDSTTIGMPKGTPGYYYQPNVPWTMYFTQFGHAIHGNYWSDPSVFGHQRTSHGCVGMSVSNAKVFYDFASVGTPVVIHY
jgi:lipoprotein-anchoring transpeptidase ErfK/SrfK